jgi:uncharacterized membrane protein
LRRAHPRPDSPPPPRDDSLETQLQHAVTGELERLVVLCDGVFAIAMTLLAVELVLPEVTSGSATNLTQRLLALGPRYLSYVLSFLVIASYWRSHQRMFRYVVRLDARFVWLNLLLLLCIAFLPFPTSVLGTYSDVAAVTLYAGTLAVTGAVILTMWLYASTGRRLIGGELSARQIQQSALRASTAPLIFALSIVIAQVDTTVAMYSWLAIALVLTVLNRLFRDGR